MASATRANATEQLHPPALVDRPLDDVIFEHTEPKSREQAMVLNGLVPTMTYQAKAMAVECVTIRGAIGQFTPIHAKSAGGVESPHWLIVWPITAAQEEEWKEKGCTYRSRDKMFGAELRYAINRQVE